MLSRMLTGRLKGGIAAICDLRFGAKSDISGALAMSVRGPKRTRWPLYNHIGLTLLPLLDYVGDYVVLWGYDHNFILGHKEFVGPHLRYLFGSELRKCL